MERKAGGIEPGGKIFRPRSCGTKPQVDPAASGLVMKLVAPRHRLHLMGDAIVARVEQHALAGQFCWQRLDLRVARERDGRPIPDQRDAVGSEYRSG